MTSIETGHIDEPENREVLFGNSCKLPLSVTCASVGEGMPPACYGSCGTVEIALRNANAAETLGLRAGDPGKDEKKARTLSCRYIP